MSRHHHSSSGHRGGNRMQAEDSSGAPSRTGVSKDKAAKAFGRDVTATKAINVAPPPMRGGLRL